MSMTGGERFCWAFWMTVFFGGTSAPAAGAINGAIGGAILRTGWKNDDGTPVVKTNLVAAAAALGYVCVMGSVIFGTLLSTPKSFSSNRGTAKAVKWFALTSFFLSSLSATIGAAINKQSENQIGYTVAATVIGATITAAVAGMFVAVIANLCCETSVASAPRLAYRNEPIDNNDGEFRSVQENLDAINRNFHERAAMRRETLAWAIATVSRNPEERVVEIPDDDAPPAFPAASIPAVEITGDDDALCAVRTMFQP